MAEQFPPAYTVAECQRALVLCSWQEAKIRRNGFASLIWSFTFPGFLSVIGMCHFLCGVCLCLENELFIKGRLSTYVFVCILTRSYGTVSWQWRVGNLGILHRSDYWMWLVGICRPLPRVTVTCCCCYLSAKGQKHLSHLICPEEWIRRQGFGTPRIKSSCLPLLPSLPRFLHT